MGNWISDGDNDDLLFSNCISNGDNDEEVTQLTVNRILESALVMATTMTCCSARRTNRPQRESED